MKKQIINVTHIVDDEPVFLTGTRAQIMLANAVKVAASRGRSQRQIAKELHYRNSTVLSHMATGRAPIPVDRAEDIAIAVGLDINRFLLAVLEQRFPKVNFRNLFNISLSANSTVAKLEMVSGASLDDLPLEVQALLAEVVAVRNPLKRWLSLPEFQIMEALRRHRPDVAIQGLTDVEMERVIGALRGQ